MFVICEVIHVIVIIIVMQCFMFENVYICTETCAKVLWILSMGSRGNFGFDFFPSLKDDMEPLLL